MGTKVRFTAAVLSLFLLLCGSQELVASSDTTPYREVSNELFITGQQDTVNFQQERDSVPKLSFWAAVNNVISSVRGIDTNYVSVPQYPFLVSVLYSGTNINNTLLSPELKEIDDGFDFPPIKMHLNIPFRNRTGVGFNYRGLGIKYFTDLSGSKGSTIFSAELFKRKFGIDIKYYQFNSVPANVTFTMDGEKYAMNTDDMALFGVNPGGFDLNTFAISGYYILNSKKFSFPAAVKYNTVQKKTAGTFFIQTAYNYSKIDASGCALFDNYFNNKTFEYTNNRFELGFGYGINIVPAGGKFMIHLSVAPLAEFYFNSSLKLENNPIPSEYPEELRKQLENLAERMDEMARAASKNTRLDFTVATRLAAVYNINSRFVFGINAGFSYTDYGTRSTFKHTSYDVNVNASFGYRFGF